MTQFPAADPIPLPAPVWLFKVLHNLTFALHLTTVELLLGGLFLGLAFGVLGRMRDSEPMVQASGIIAHRLPTLMAFVINLGVPPLLFAQVLYGRALYTSSVLIGAYWFSVILLLMGSYYGLYVSAKRAEARRQWAAPGFAALLLVLTIAFIYSNNMTLMLRPQVWASMYHASPAGVQLNTSDPVLLPRWLFFIFGAFPVTGGVLALLALRNQADENRRFLARAGGLAMVMGIAAQTIAGYVAIGSQPEGVMHAVMQNPIYSGCFYGWLGAAVLVLIAGVAISGLKRPNVVLAAFSAVAAFVVTACTVMVRDGIRDVTLRAAGFEVWDRQIVTNWSVVGVFVVLLLAAAAIVIFLVATLAKARRIEEKYA